jgi:hypothetical protein
VDPDETTAPTSEPPVAAPSSTSATETASSMWRRPLPPRHLKPPHLRWHPLLQRIASSSSPGETPSRVISSSPSLHLTLLDCIMTRVMTIKIMDLLCTHRPICPVSWFLRGLANCEYHCRSEQSTLIIHVALLLHTWYNRFLTDMLYLPNALLLEYYQKCFSLIGVAWFSSDCVNSSKPRNMYRSSVRNCRGTSLGDGGK